MPSETTVDAQSGSEGAADSAGPGPPEAAASEAVGAEASERTSDVPVTLAEPVHPLVPTPPDRAQDTTPRASERQPEFEQHEPTATASSSAAACASERSAPASTSAPAAAATPGSPKPRPSHLREEDRMHPIIDGLFHHLHIFFRWLSNDGRSAAGFNDINMASSDPYTGLAGGSQIKDGDDSTPNSALVMSYEKCMLGAHPHTIIREDTGPIAPVDEVVRGRDQLKGEASAHAV